MNDDYDFGESKPRWQCQECGYTDERKPMPNVESSVWYAKHKPHKCPKCKSESFHPVGW